MSILYKLTDENNRTRNNTQWGENVTHHATGSGDFLCSDAFIHAYENPLLAVLFNPIHADFLKPNLWEAKGDTVVREGQLKCGCKSLTTIKQIPVPTITINQRIAFAVHVALSVYDEPKFTTWAASWLSGADRSKVAADDAYAAAKVAAYAADDAAIAAAYAAYAAAAIAAAYAAYADAAIAAATAAYAADAAYAEIDFISIINQVLGA